jgi:zinc protease
MNSPRNAALAPPRPPAGFSFEKSEGGIHEYRLMSNGLSVLLLKDGSAPVVTAMVTYRVGSRNEAAGYTGATHLLEHLMFKGSRHFNKRTKREIWTLLEARGAYVNATTWNDRTNYFAVLPREHLADALAIEADRMRGAFIRERDRRAEMPVVRNEFERGENDPVNVLNKHLWAAAYQAHPYHHDTIGWRADIEGVSIPRLKAFYDDFYWPNNATLSIIGDFDEATVFSLIAEHFGSVPRSHRAIPPMYAVEPPQEGPRSVVVERGAGVRIVAVAHKAPAALHPDTCALLALGVILADGKSSRLHAALVDTGLASEVTPMNFPFRDPGLFITLAFLTPRARHEAVEARIRAEYAAVARRGVSDAELAKAKKIVEAAAAYGRDGTRAVAMALNEAIAVGDWTSFVRFPALVAAISREDIRRVAAKYLTESQRTSGWYRPKQEPKKTAASGGKRVARRTVSPHS